MDLSYRCVRGIVGDYLARQNLFRRNCLSMGPFLIHFNPATLELGLELNALPRLGVL
jgi:hypothetical protein